MTEDEIVERIVAMTPTDRLSLLDRWADMFCLECGCHHPSTHRCRCWDDE